MIFPAMDFINAWFFIGGIIAGATLMALTIRGIK